jgi:hypothetical protein
MVDVVWIKQGQREQIISGEKKGVHLPIMTPLGCPPRGKGEWPKLSC